jgi:superfamily II DNA or RNA helicase
MIKSDAASGFDGKASIRIASACHTVARFGSGLVAWIAACNLVLTRVLHVNPRFLSHWPFRTMGVCERMNAQQQLLLHQLRVLEWLDAQATPEAHTVSDPAPEEVSVPDRWMLTAGVERLYSWQEECIDRWFAAGRRGTVKVVTGAGKTVLALAIAQRLQNEIDSRLRLVIVVPTIVLLNQWSEELRGGTNLPAGAIKRIGGTHDDVLDSGWRVLITVLAGASKKLATRVQAAGGGEHVMLIVDECHRAGASEMVAIFETDRAYSLGLSATPERTDEDDDAGAADPLAPAQYDTSLLGRAIGPIVYELTLAQALVLGIVPSFAIHHYGLPLSAAEQVEYDRLTRSIRDSEEQLRGVWASKRRGAAGGLFRWAQVQAASGNDVSATASRYIGDTSRRKQLLYRMRSRRDGVLQLIAREMEMNSSARIITFHERIAQVMELFESLRDAGLPVVCEHSNLPASVREQGLDLFRRGVAQVIVSAKSLIEGFNVPAADVGIVVASSSSVRQRVQTLGRVLRRHCGSAGEEKTSQIHVFYAAGTVEEAIYSKVDWGVLTGVDSNSYHRWTPGEAPEAMPGPPRLPLPTDDEVDPATLKPGDIYPGRYEGTEYSCDTRGNVHSSDDRLAIDTQDLVRRIKDTKGGAGRFRITPQRNYVLVRVEDADGWSTRFVRQLVEPLSFDTTQAEATPAADVLAYAAGALPGDVYPFRAAVKERLKFRQLHGGTIAKRIRRGDLFARTVATRVPESAETAQSLIAALTAVRARGNDVSSFDINTHDHAVYEAGGRKHFLHALSAPLEFPDDHNT